MAINFNRRGPINYWIDNISTKHSDSNAIILVRKHNLLQFVLLGEKEKSEKRKKRQRKRREAEKRKKSSFSLSSHSLLARLLTRSFIYFISPIFPLLHPAPPVISFPLSFFIWHGSFSNLPIKCPKAIQILKWNCDQCNEIAFFTIKFMKYLVSKRRF